MAHDNAPASSVEDFRASTAIVDQSAYVVETRTDDYSGGWYNAVVRTSDGEEVGTDGWVLFQCPEDASFTRDLAWVLRELNDQAVEVEALRTFVRLTVDRFHEDTPMGPNVVDLPDVRWRILPPHAAKAVQRALENGSKGTR